MATDYHRSFTAGRGSEQLMNDDLHKTVESVRHLLDVPENGAAMPDDVELHGSLWLNMDKNELNYFNSQQNAMVNVFSDKFCITDHLMDDLPPSNPVPGTFWITNGALMYFDGTTWGPIKAITEDGSQFNIAAFEDFALLSPMQPSGNTVVDDIVLTEEETFRRAVIEGKLDPENNAQWLETDEKFGPNWTLNVDDPTTPDTTIPADVMTQFLVPNSKIGRFFLNGVYIPDAVKKNGVCIQYPKVQLVDKVPSFIHVNPGKVSKIKKRLIKIDKLNARIAVSANNTEFYGFQKDSPLGVFLRPGADQDHGDYVTVPEGINLNYNATQNFDYLMAVSYEFSWIRATGLLSVSDNEEKSSCYYLGSYGGPINIFVDGYNLENDAFKYDSESKVVNFDDDVTDMEISVIKNTQHEYGFIRELTYDGRGIIKLLNKYVQPLVLINGEAVHPLLGGVEIDGDKIYITGAQRNMPWSVIELKDIVNNDDMFYATGTVEDSDNSGNGLIYYDASLITANDGMVLFVDGLLVKKEDIVRNEAQQYITVEGLVKGCEYILLKDKYQNLYSESLLVPAFKTGRIDDSLVYLNGRVLCNDVAFVTTQDKSEEAINAVNGEMKLFIVSVLDRTVGEYCVYDEYNRIWKTMDVIDQAALSSVIKGYENSLRAVKLNVDYDPDSDKMVVYSFRYASNLDKDITTHSEFVPADPTTAFGVSRDYKRNEMSVWIDGIRQHDVNTLLPMQVGLFEPVYSAKSLIVNTKTGEAELLSETEAAERLAAEKIVAISEDREERLKEIKLEEDLSKMTYALETKDNSSQNEVDTTEPLTAADIVEGTVNVYRTKNPLYPGRVVVYINGLRQPKESWTIIDNHTLMFKSQTVQLIGSPNNFPQDTVTDGHGNQKTITRKCTDTVLVEVRKNDFQCKERTIIWTETDNWDIDIAKYDLPIDILEAQSERIFIFIDGVFTGLKATEGYRIDRAKGCITILAGDVVEALCVDPLASYFATNPDKALRWQEKHGGVPYTPSVHHTITLEWR